MHVSVDCALVPLTRAMLMALNPFLCGSAVVVSVIFVAIFLASSYRMSFMCRWLRIAMCGMPSMSTEMNAFMYWSLCIVLVGGELGISTLKVSLIRMGA